MYPAPVELYKGVNVYTTAYGRNPVQIGLAVGGDLQKIISDIIPVESSGGLVIALTHDLKMRLGPKTIVWFMELRERIEGQRQGGLHRMQAPGGRVFLLSADIAYRIKNYGISDLKRAILQQKPALTFL